MSSDSPCVQPLPEETNFANLQLRNVDSVSYKDDLLCSNGPKQIVSAYEVPLIPVSQLKVTQF